MPELSVALFDDAVARRWEPFALTRPAGELLFGTLTLRARAEAIFGAPCALHVAAEHLQGFGEEGCPPVGRATDLPADRDRLFLLSRAVPDWSARQRWRPPVASGPGPIHVGGRVAGWYAPAGAPVPEPGLFDEPDALGGADPAVLDLPGVVLDHVWELISRNAAQIEADVAALHPHPSRPDLPAGVHHWGEHPLIVDASARLEPGCAFDTSEGPIWLDRGVVVRAFTRLCGPAYIGPRSAVLGGAVECVSLGPVCKVRGELSSTICLGYTNKQHDGHIGHAYLGRWVNLGAGTNNSDLKNNYGTIRLWSPTGEIDTGEIKLGCLLGDHVKTGIGLLLNTGTVVGAGSNLYGAAMPPKYVPPFSWGTGEELVEYRLDKFLEVAERAMQRRDVTLPESQRAQLGRAWERSRRAPGT